MKNLLGGIMQQIQNKFMLIKHKTAIRNRLEMEGGVCVLFSELIDSGLDIELTTYTPCDVSLDISFPIKARGSRPFVR